MATYLQNLNFPALACNIDAHGHWSGDHLQPYVVKYVAGHKVRGWEGARVGGGVSTRVHVHIG